MKANKDRIEAAQAKGRQMPYFIKDNFKDGDPTKELRWIGEKKTAASATTTPAKPKKLTPKEIGDWRHAARTQKQIDSIQNLCDVRRLDLYDAKIEAARKTLTGSTSPNNTLKALSKRETAIHNAIADHKSVAEVEKLMARYKHGVEVQKAWDKILWDGFSKEQIDNCHEIEKEMGILKGRRMSYEQADKQKCNPKAQYEWEPTKGNKPSRLCQTINGQTVYVERNPKYDPKVDYQPYYINCQTCAPAYQLREWGFNIQAGANTRGSLSEYLSKGNNWLQTWQETDGASVDTHYMYFTKWMAGKKYARMTPERFREYFEEICKEEGTYEIGLSWKSGGGHCTVIKRFKDGTLKYIEPQHDNSAGTGWEAEDIDYLCHEMKIVSMLKDGILRVDDKILNIKYVSIFLKN